MQNTSKAEDSAMTRKEWYRQVYLRSDHWKQTRIKALTSSHFSCCGCGCKDMLQVHHLTYENLGSESGEDLMVLCSRCHGLAHDLLREMREKIDTMTQRKVLSHFLYYATVPKGLRKRETKAKKNHKFNKLPMSVRKMVSKAKKSLKSKSNTP